MLTIFYNKKNVQYEMIYFQITRSQFSHRYKLKGKKKKIKKMLDLKGEECLCLKLLYTNTLSSVERNLELFQKFYII